MTASTWTREPDQRSSNISFWKDVEGIFAADLEKKILERFRSQSYQPPALPAVAVKLLDFMCDPQSKTDEIVQLLEEDPMLAAQITRAANSPLYRGRYEIRSIRDVIVRLGRKRLTDCVMEVAVSTRIFMTRDYADVLNHVTKHSRATAHLSQLVARHSLHDDQFAFLCGLLHDIGIAGALITLGDVPRNEKIPVLDSLKMNAFESIHQEASAIICAFWNLPREIVEVVQCHHDPFDDGEVNTVGAMVCLGESLANQFGYRWVEGEHYDNTNEEVLNACRDALKISQARWEFILEDAQQILEQL